MATKPYTIHPLANIFPRMSPAEFKALVEDIRINGVRQPITLHLNQILDGRHRYDAAKEAKRDLTDKDFVELKPGDDALKFVISQNVNRRHLSESQRGIIAAEIANLQKGANQHTMVGSSIDLPTASKMMNVGEATVKRARNVLVKAAPEIVEQIRHGKTKVSAVTKTVLAKPKAQQVKALAEEIERKKRTVIMSDQEYNKAENKLIEKLTALKPETADAAA